MNEKEENYYLRKQLEIIRKEYTELNQKYEKLQREFEEYKRRHPETVGVKNDKSYAIKQKRQR